MRLLEHRFKTSDRTESIVRELRGPPLGITAYAESEKDTFISAGVCDLSRGLSGSTQNKADFDKIMRLMVKGKVLTTETQLG